ncbi:hypothetical protein OTU49_000165 [Cherax quadricarinatus]|uniref:G-protein coupled receptors family 1 profile domain-containing protein n=1 Tax=Cherax quadricarinatus TaxID=27406 RepID=A0AAW0Y0J5_CHEQU|nr:beta-1 adrenergic receptor-like [Cherax quadricarinatus]
MMTTHTVPVNDTLDSTSSQDISVVVTAALLAVLGVVFVFGTLVNSLVFLVFYRRPSLRSLSNRFVLSLTSANLVSTVMVVPVHALRLGGLTPLLTPSTAAEGADGGHYVSRGDEEFWWCQVSKALMALAVEAAIFSVLLIAVDRYCAVTSPLHYSMTITRGRSVRLILGVWMLALLYALPQLLAHTHAHLHPASRLSSCPDGQDVVSLVPITFGLYYAVLLALCGFLVPLLVLCWIYVRMYRAARRNSARTRRHSVCHNPAEIIVPDCPSTPDSGNHNSVRCKSRPPRRRSANISFSSLFFREEGRAVKTAVIVIASFVTSWLPYFIFKIFEAGGWTRDIPYVDEVVTYIALSSSCTSPFIYVYRNETASKEVLKIVCWWRPPSPASPTFSRSSHHPKMGNGHTTTPVRIIEPDTASLYSYAAECGTCGHNQLVCSLRNGRPVTSPLPPDKRRASSPRRESTVSFKLTPMDRPASRCRQCLRQDSASSASSDDPLLSDCYRHHRPSNPSVRWTRPRMSNGSVTTRSDSLASTNSSVLSAGIQRWPIRRYSTVSTDSGGTITRRSAHEEPEEDGVSARLHPPGGQRSLFLESEEDSYDAGNNQPEIHGYANPFRHPRLSHRQESVGSSVRFIWEIDEGDGPDDDTAEGEAREAPPR